MNIYRGGWIKAVRVLVDQTLMFEPLDIPLLALFNRILNNV